MVPDMLIGNVKFLEELPDEEKKIFEEAAEECTRVERESWDKQSVEAKQQAADMGVEFIYPDINLFKDKVTDLQKEIVEDNQKLKPIYDEIQKVNKEVAGYGGNVL